MILVGHTKLSSRGQIVIPKSIRDSWGVASGSELEVLFDGFTLSIRVASAESSVGSDLVVRETPMTYGASPSAESTGLQSARRLESNIWVERALAIDAIKRLRSEFTGLDSEELLRVSRQELMDRSTPCK